MKLNWIDLGGTLSSITKNYSMQTEFYMHIYNLSFNYLYSLKGLQ